MTADADYEEATQARALRARAAVAGQLHGMLTEGDFIGGGRGEVALRLQQVALAERRGDDMALRGAVMDAAAAFGAWAARLDCDLVRP